MTTSPGRWQLPGGSVEPPPDREPLDLAGLTGPQVPYLEPVLRCHDQFWFTGQAAAGSQRAGQARR